MGTQSLHELPPEDDDDISLRFSSECEDECARLSAERRSEVARFFRLLQKDPLAAEIIERCEINGEYFACTLDGCLALYWTVEYDEQDANFNSIRYRRPRSVLVLAVKKLISSA